MTNKKARGIRKKTRNKFTRHKARLTPNTLLKSFKVGTIVHISIDSSVHSGLPHHRFHGLTGVVTGQRGKAMIVSVYLGNAKKELIVHAAHLQPQKGHNASVANTKKRAKKAKRKGKKQESK